MYWLLFGGGVRCFAIVVVEIRGQTSNRFEVLTHTRTFGFFTFHVAASIAAAKKRN